MSVAAGRVGAVLPRGVVGGSGGSAAAGALEGGALAPDLSSSDRPAHSIPVEGAAVFAESFGLSGDGAVVAERLATLRELWLPQILELIEEVMASELPESSPLAELCAYQLGSGGKRLRALLPLIVAEELGCEPRLLLPLGAACEVLHNATLVHDDLQDRDRYRRGRESAWWRFGPARAINLGDALMYVALSLLDRLDGPLALRHRCAMCFRRQTLRVIDGQEREFALCRCEQPTIEQYLTMVEGKTGALLALASEAAAMICGAPAEIVEGLGQALRDLGVLLQIQDDLVDLYGNKGRGRRGSDIREGKRTILVVHALVAAEPAEAAWLRSILDQGRELGCPMDLERVADVFERAGSLELAFGELASRLRRAASLPALASRPGLRALVAGLGEVLLEPLRRSRLRQDAGGAAKLGRVVP